jgi:hypothetical protein
MSVGPGSIVTTERIGKTLSGISGIKSPAVLGNTDAAVGLCEAANGNGVYEGAIDEALWGVGAVSSGSCPTGRLLPFSDEAIETFCTEDQLRSTWITETMDWVMRSAGLTTTASYNIFFQARLLASLRRGSDHRLQQLKGSLLRGLWWGVVHQTSAVIKMTCACAPQQDRSTPRR